MADYQFFKEEYTTADFTAATDTTVTSDEFRTVLRQEAEKGEVIQLGQGRAESQTDAVGRIYADIKDTGSSPTLIDGKVRFVVENSQGQVVHIISSHNTATVNAGASDRSQRRPYALKQSQVAEPYSLAVQVKTASGTDTFSEANSSLNVDGYRAEAVN